MEAVVYFLTLQSYDLAVPIANRFTCYVKFINTKVAITPGFPVMFYSRGNAIDASIKKLNAILDRNDSITKSRPRV